MTDIGRPIAETEMKLQDAGAQLRLALQHAHDEELFRSCINGFIAQARSVTFVMERESAPFPELLAWYKAQMEDLGPSPLFRFFNSQRVYSIHQGVVQATRKSYPIQSAFRVIDPAAPPREPETLEIDLRGNVEFQVRDIIRAQSDGTAFGWYFDDPGCWTGPSTNVLGLCRTYFKALRWLVEAWVFRWYHLTREHDESR